MDNNRPFRRLLDRRAGLIYPDSFYDDSILDIVIKAPEPESTTSYFAGLDLGQAHDYTAMAIIERVGTKRGEYKFNCLHLQRWELRTSYPAIVADTVRIMNSPELQRGDQRPVLAVDAAGVGAPVVDLLHRERMTSWTLLPVLITGGADETKENGTYRVPKRNLVSAMQVALQQQTLQVAPGLPEAANLSREMQNFQVKINDNAHDSYGAWREGTHNDLVLAVALSLWATEFGGAGGVFLRFLEMSRLPELIAGLEAANAKLDSL